MEDKEREEYEERLHDKDERISELMDQLGNAVDLLKEIRSLAGNV